jgi:hypothetical protein
MRNALIETLFAESNHPGARTLSIAADSERRTIYRRFTDAIRSSPYRFRDDRRYRTPTSAPDASTAPAR